MEKPKKITYTIQSGDTLRKIAADHNTHIPMILADNPHINHNKLQPGDTICVYPNSAIISPDPSPRCPSCPPSVIFPDEPLPTPELTPPCIPPGRPIPAPPPSESLPTPELIPPPVRPPRPPFRPPVRPPFRPRPPVIQIPNPPSVRPPFRPIPPAVTPRPPIMPLDPAADGLERTGELNELNDLNELNEANCIKDIRHIFLGFVGAKHNMIMSKVHNLGDFEHINMSMHMLPRQLAGIMGRYYAHILLEAMTMQFARHFMLFEAMLDAHIKNDLNRIAETEKELSENAGAISKAFEDMNPAFAAISVRQMMNVQIDFTKKLIATRIAENYKENLEILEQAERHASECADNILTIMLES